MVTTVRQFFTPPVFPGDEDKTGIARVLYALLANMLVVLALAVIATLFVFLQKTFASSVIALLLALVLVAYALAQRGRVRLASALFVTGMWLVFTPWLLLYGTVTNPIVAEHVALAVIAGILLGRRAAILTAALSCSVGLGLAILENAGYPLVHFFPSPPLSSWIGWVLAYLWMLPPLYLTLQGSAQSLARARQSEKRYATLFNEAPMMYLTVREESGEPVITDCNAAFSRNLGYPREQVVGQSLARYYTPPSRAALLGEGGFQRELRNEIAGPIERDLVAQDGRIIPTLLRVAPEVDEAGQSVGVLAMYLDVAERKATEELLHRSEEKFAKAFKASPIMVIIARITDARLIEVNESFERIMGYTRAEAVGGSSLENRLWVNPGDRERLLPILLANGTLRNEEILFRTKDGEVLTCLLSAELIELEGKGFALGVIENITERKRAEQELSRRAEDLLLLNSIASIINAAAGIDSLLKTALDRIVDALHLERAAIHLLDPNTGAFAASVGHGLTEEMLDDMRAFFSTGHPFTPSLAAGHPAVIESPTGQPWLKWSPVDADSHIIVPLGSPEKRVGILILFGCGRRASSPQGLEFLAALGNQIGAAVQNARLSEKAAEVEVLRELDKLRAALVANVSHELRTPLGLIKLFCTNLLREDAHFEDRDRREFLEQIDKETDRLEAIVDNLLDLSRIQSGRFQLDVHPTDLTALIRDTLSGLQAQDTRYRFVQHLEPLPPVSVDPRRIVQVLRNLIANAIKYSPDGGTIILRSVQDGQRVLVQVVDQGIGIAQPDLARVFDRFYRVDNKVTRTVGGVGLGLAICRGIVEAHRGQIWAESALNRGSTFSFTLPLDPGKTRDN